MIKKVSLAKTNLKFEKNVARYTIVRDLEAIIYLSKIKKGNILEIGCNVGATTNEFAKNNPKKIIYGIDFVENEKIKPQQKSEIPKKIGSKIKYKNVIIKNEDSSKINFNEFNYLDFIFIDGDHSLEGVKIDSEKSFQYFKEKKRNGIICWHDCREDSPEWCGVKKYLESISNKYKIYWFENTWVAFTFVRNTSMI